MEQHTWTDRWWEAVVVVLAINSLVFAVLAGANDEVMVIWVIVTGILPAVLLLAGLAILGRRRGVGTAMIVVGSVLGAAWWWMIYPVALAAIVLVGGFASAKIGPKRVQTQPAL